MALDRIDRRQLDLGPVLFFEPFAETPPGNQIVIRAGNFSKSLVSQLVLRPEQTTVGFVPISAAINVRWDLVYLDTDGVPQILLGTEVLNISSEFTGVPSLPRNIAFPLAYVKITETVSVEIDESDITDVRPIHHFWEQTPTGTLRNSLAASPEFGWLELNGDTIGNTSSGATIQGEELRPLFDLLKLVTPNTGAEVFDNNDAVIIPNCPGRFFVNQDTGDTEFDVIGEKAGVKTVDTSHSHDTSVGVTVSNDPGHTHGLGSHTHSGGTTSSAGAHSHGGSTGGTIHAGTEAAGDFAFGSSHTHPISSDGSHTHPQGATGGGVGASDSGGTHAHTLSGFLPAGTTPTSLPPYVVCRTFIKI